MNTSTQEPSKLEIRLAGITRTDADVVVNAANSALQEGAGVCGVIFREAGARRLQAACDAIGKCETGSAVITPGFGLKAKYIIHAVGPVYMGGSRGEARKLAGCYEKSMQLAMENGCHSIAFPLISAGIYGYPKKEAWQVALSAVTGFQEKHGDYRLDVCFCVIDSEVQELGESILKLYRAQ